jgi:hypothetical protein
VSTSADSTGAPASVPAAWADLVDDAAVFPPGEAPLPDAVATYRERRDEPWAPLVGSLVVGDRSLPELAGLADPGAPPLPVSVVCSGGAGSLGPAAHWARATAGVELATLEVALRDLDDLPGAARRVVRAADGVAISGVEVPVHVEMPPLPPHGQPGTGWLDALDEIAAADLRVKLRTGGLEADLFPTASALAAGIDAALDRELPFKCTAGLHRAVRHRASTGFEHHGFLNVLLATRASLDGGDPVEVLEEDDPAALLATLHELGPDALARTRRWFVSFGCCGVEHPHHDLVELGLL